MATTKKKAELGFDPTQFKKGLLVPVDMGAFKIVSKTRTTVPFDGESVWLEPYMSSETELALAEARDSLGEDAEDTASFNMMTDTLADLVLGHNLSDKYGEPIPQFVDGAAVRKHLPSRAVLFLMEEVIGGEPDPEGGGASGA